MVNRTNIQCCSTPQVSSYRSLPPALVRTTRIPDSLVQVINTNTKLSAIESHSPIERAQNNPCIQYENIQLTRIQYLKDTHRINLTLNMNLFREPLKHNVTLENPIGPDRKRIMSQQECNILQAKINQNHFAWQDNTHLYKTVIRLLSEDSKFVNIINHSLQNEVLVKAFFRLYPAKNKTNSTCPHWMRLLACMAAQNPLTAMIPGEFGLRFNRLAGPSESKTEYTPADSSERMPECSQPDAQDTVHFDLSEADEESPPVQQGYVTTLKNAATSIANHLGTLINHWTRFPGAEAAMQPVTEDQSYTMVNSEPELYIDDVMMDKYIAAGLSTFMPIGADLSATSILLQLYSDYETSHCPGPENEILMLPHCPQKLLNAVKEKLGISQEDNEGLEKRLIKLIARKLFKELSMPLQDWLAQQEPGKTLKYLREKLLFRVKSLSSREAALTTAIQHQLADAIQKAPDFFERWIVAALDTPLLQRKDLENTLWGSSDHALFEMVYRADPSVNCDSLSEKQLRRYVHAILMTIADLSTTELENMPTLPDLFNVMAQYLMSSQLLDQDELQSRDNVAIVFERFINAYHQTLTQQALIYFKQLREELAPLLPVIVADQVLRENGYDPAQNVILSTRTDYPNGNSIKELREMSLIEAYLSFSVEGLPKHSTLSGGNITESTFQRLPDFYQQYEKHHAEFSNQRQSEFTTFLKNLFDWAELPDHIKNVKIWQPAVCISKRRNIADQSSQYEDTDLTLDGRLLELDNTFYLLNFNSTKPFTILTNVKTADEASQYIENHPADFFQNWQTEKEWQTGNKNELFQPYFLNWDHVKVSPGHHLFTKSIKPESYTDISSEELANKMAMTLTKEFFPRQEMKVDSRSKKMLRLLLSFIPLYDCIKDKTIHSCAVDLLEAIAGTTKAGIKSGNLIAKKLSVKVVGSTLKSSKISRQKMLINTALTISAELPKLTRTLVGVAAKEAVSFAVPGLSMIKGSIKLTGPLVKNAVKQFREKLTLNLNKLPNDDFSTLREELLQLKTSNIFYDNNHGVWCALKSSSSDAVQFEVRDLTINNQQVKNVVVQEDNGILYALDPGTKKLLFKLEEKICIPTQGISREKRSPNKCSVPAKAWTPDLNHHAITIKTTDTTMDFSPVLQVKLKDQEVSLHSKIEYIFSDNIKYHQVSVPGGSYRWVDDEKDAAISYSPADGIESKQQNKFSLENYKAARLVKYENQLMLEIEYLIGESSSKVLTSFSCEPYQQIDHQHKTQPVSGVVVRTFLPDEQGVLHAYECKLPLSKEYIETHTMDNTIVLDRSSSAAEVLLKGGATEAPYFISARISATQLTPQLLSIKLLEEMSQQWTTRHQVQLSSERILERIQSHITDRLNTQQASVSYQLIESQLTNLYDFFDNPDQNVFRAKLDGLENDNLNTSMLQNIPKQKKILEEIAFLEGQLTKSEEALKLISSSNLENIRWGINQYHQAQQSFQEKLQHSLLETQSEIKVADGRNLKISNLNEAEKVITLLNNFATHYRSGKNPNLKSPTEISSSSDRIAAEAINSEFDRLMQEIIVEFNQAPAIPELSTLIEILRKTGPSALTSSQSVGIFTTSLKLSTFWHSFRVHFGDKISQKSKQLQELMLDIQFTRMVITKLEQRIWDLTDTSGYFKADPTTNTYILRDPMTNQPLDREGVNKILYYSQNGLPYMRNGDEAFLVQPVNGLAGQWVAGVYNSESGQFIPVDLSTHREITELAEPFQNAHFMDELFSVRCKRGAGSSKECSNKVNTFEFNFANPEQENLIKKFYQRAPEWPKNLPFEHKITAKVTEYYANIQYGGNYVWGNSGGFLVVTKGEKHFLTPNDSGSIQSNCLLEIERAPDDRWNIKPLMEEKDGKTLQYYYPKRNVIECGTSCFVDYSGTVPFPIKPEFRRTLMRDLKPESDYEIIADGRTAMKYPEPQVSIRWRENIGSIVNTLERIEIKLQDPANLNTYKQLVEAFFEEPATALAKTEVIESYTGIVSQIKTVLKFYETHPEQVLFYRQKGTPDFYQTAMHYYPYRILVVNERAIINASPNQIKNTLVHEATHGVSPHFRFDLGYLDKMFFLRLGNTVSNRLQLIKQMNFEHLNDATIKLFTGVDDVARAKSLLREDKGVRRLSRQTSADMWALFINTLAMALKVD